MIVLSMTIGFGDTAQKPAVVCANLNRSMIPKIFPTTIPMFRQSEESTPKESVLRKE